MAAQHAARLSVWALVTERKALKMLAASPPSSHEPTTSSPLTAIIAARALPAPLLQRPSATVAGSLSLPAVTDSIGPHWQFERPAAWAVTGITLSGPSGPTAETAS